MTSGQRRDGYKEEKEGGKDSEKKHLQRPKETSRDPKESFKNRTVKENIKQNGWYRQGICRNSKRSM